MLYSGFEMFPKDNQRLLAEAQIAAVSPWALDNLLSAYKGQRADIPYNFYRSIMKAPKMGILRGQMFKRQVLKFFAGLKENTQFRIRSLDDSTTSHWVYPGPTTNSAPHIVRALPFVQSHFFAGSCDKCDWTIKILAEWTKGGGWTMCRVELVVVHRSTH